MDFLFLDFDGNKFMIVSCFNKHSSQVNLCFSSSFGFNLVQLSKGKCSKYLFLANELSLVHFLVAALNRLMFFLKCLFICFLNKIAPENVFKFS